MGLRNHMNTPTKNPTPASNTYPKRIKRTLELEVEVLTLESENYFLSSSLDDDLLGDIGRGLLPEANISLCAINGIKIRP